MSYDQVCRDCGTSADRDNVIVHTRSCPRVSWVNNVQDFQKPIGGGILQTPGEQDARRALDAITELRERIEVIEAHLNIDRGN